MKQSSLKWNSRKCLLGMTTQESEEEWIFFQGNFSRKDFHEHWSSRKKCKVSMWFAMREKKKREFCWMSSFSDDVAHECLCEYWIPTSTLFQLASTVCVSWKHLKRCDEKNNPSHWTLNLELSSLCFPYLCVCVSETVKNFSLHLTSITRDVKKINQE